jgi:hypothetical protein
MNAAAFFKKHKYKIGLALFLVTAAAAVFFITNGVVSLGNKDPGYYAIDVLPDAQVTVFDSGLHFTLYAEGSSNEIKRTLNEASAAYSSSLERHYKLLDADNEYEGYVNLATLNARPGEAIQVSEALFAVLSDALTKTEENQGYSLFDGALFAEWRTLRYLEDPTDFDPINDPEMGERLALIAEQTRLGAPCTLRIVDANERIVSFEMSDAYRAFLAEQEITAPPLHLNLLQDAYLIQLVADEMAAQGFGGGYLYTDSGLSVMLNRDDRAFTLYGCIDNQVVKAGDVIAPPNTVFCQMTAFPLSENNYGYYTIEANGRAQYRHPWFDGQTGACSETLLSAAVLGAGKPVDTLYKMLPLVQATDAKEFADRLLSLGDDCLLSAYSLQDDPSTLYTHAAQNDALYLVEDAPFTAAQY